MSESKKIDKILLRSSNIFSHSHKVSALYDEYSVEKLSIKQKIQVVGRTFLKEYYNAIEKNVWIIFIALLFSNVFFISIVIENTTYVFLILANIVGIIYLFSKYVIERVSVVFVRWMYSMERISSSFRSIVQFMKWKSLEERSQEDIEEYLEEDKRELENISVAVRSYME